MASAAVGPSPHASEDDLFELEVQRELARLRSSMGLPAPGKPPAAPVRALPGLLAAAPVGQPPASQALAAPFPLAARQPAPDRPSDAQRRAAAAQAYAEELRAQMEEASARRRAEREALLPSPPPVPTATAGRVAAAASPPPTPPVATRAAGPIRAFRHSGLGVDDASQQQQQQQPEWVDAVAAPPYAGSAPPTPPSARRRASFGGAPQPPASPPRASPPAAVPLPSAAGNLPADALRAAVASGASFVRSRGHSLPPEARAAAAERAAARARYEADLLAQMQEQAARRARERAEATEERRTSAGHHLLLPGEAGEGCAQPQPRGRGGRRGGGDDDQLVGAATPPRRRGGWMDAAVAPPQRPSAAAAAADASAQPSPPRALASASVYHVYAPSPPAPASPAAGGIGGGGRRLLLPAVGTFQPVLHPTPPRIGGAAGAAGLRTWLLPPVPGGGALSPAAPVQWSAGELRGLSQLAAVADDPGPAAAPALPAASVAAPGWLHSRGGAASFPLPALPAVPALPSTSEFVPATSPVHVLFAARADEAAAVGGGEGGGAATAGAGATTAARATLDEAQEGEEERTPHHTAAPRAATVEAATSPLPAAASASPPRRLAAAPGGALPPHILSPSPVGSPSSVASFIGRLDVPRTPRRGQVEGAGDTPVGVPSPRAPNTAVAAAAVAAGDSQRLRDVIAHAADGAPSPWGGAQVSLSFDAGAEGGSVGGGASLVDGELSTADGGGVAPPVVQPQWTTHEGLSPHASDEHGGDSGAVGFDDAAPQSPPRSPPPPPATSDDQQQQQQQHPRRPSLTGVPGGLGSTGPATAALPGAPQQSAVVEPGVPLPPPLQMVGLYGRAILRSGAVPAEPPMEQPPPPRALLPLVAPTYAAGAVAFPSHHHRAARARTSSDAAGGIPLDEIAQALAEGSSAASTAAGGASAGGSGGRRTAEGREDTYDAPGDAFEPDEDGSNTEADAGHGGGGDSGGVSPATPAAHLARPGWVSPATPPAVYVPPPPSRGWASGEGLSPVLASPPAAGVAEYDYAAGLSPLSDDGGGAAAYGGGFPGEERGAAAPSAGSSTAAPYRTAVHPLGGDASLSLGASGSGGGVAASFVARLPHPPPMQHGAGEDEDEAGEEGAVAESIKALPLAAGGGGVPAASRAPSAPAASGWALPPGAEGAHKAALLHFYAAHVPAKAHAAHVDAAWAHYGPGVWRALQDKYGAPAVAQYAAAAEGGAAAPS